MLRRYLLAASALALVASACSSVHPAQTPTQSAPAPTTAASTGPAATAAPVPTGPAILAVCHDQQACTVSAGSYLTGPSGFFPGLAITVPNGWRPGELDAGELSLGPIDHPDDHLELWKDVRVVVSNHWTHPADTIVESVGQTPAAFIKWFTTDRDFDVIEKPVSITIGGVDGQALAVDISTTANYGDAGCPANPRCADFVTDPKHWGSDFFGTGGDAADWMFFASVHYPTGDHLFAIVLDAPSPAELTKFRTEAQAVIDSLIAPTTYMDN
jgi:hypothetical protein